MIKFKDKELREELATSGVITIYGKDLLQSQPIGPRITELISKMEAICRFLEIEIVENLDSSPIHVAFKKNSAEARKHQKKKAAGAVSWDEAVFPWKIR